jgi:methyl-accepting chemotaxis protein
MTNHMDLEKISLAVSTLIAIFMAYLYWRELKLKKDKAPTENALNVSVAVKNLSEALGMQTDELAEALKDSAQLRADLTKAKVETALRVAETAKHRKETDDKIAELTENNEAMSAKIAASEEQIEKLNREYTREISRILMGVKAYMSELLQYFETHNLSDYPIPPEDLLDTNSKIILQKRKEKK